MAIFKAKKTDDALGFWPSWTIPAPIEPPSKWQVERRKSPVKNGNSVKTRKSANA